MPQKGRQRSEVICIVRLLGKVSNLVIKRHPQDSPTKALFYNVSESASKYSVSLERVTQPGQRTTNLRSSANQRRGWLQCVCSALYEVHPRLLLPLLALLLTDPGQGPELMCPESSGLSKAGPDYHMQGA